MQQWDGADTASPPPTPVTSPIERAIAAIRRYKFVVIGVALLGIAGGVAATRLVTPQYEVNAKIWIQSETPIGDKSGPIRPAELLNASAWVELLKSYRVSDAVVRKLKLYVKPAKQADLPLFAEFGVRDTVLWGSYDLTIDRGRRRWTLMSTKFAIGDSGSVVDSVGRRLGFHWLLPPAAFAGTGKRVVSFTVSTPRETARALGDQLHPQLIPESNFLSVSLQEPDPQLAANTLNTWVDEFVSVAGDLKKQNLVELANILSQQLSYAETSLHTAENSLEQFRVNTITLPTEGNGPVAAGVEATRDLATKSFFDQKQAYDNVRNDREALQNSIAQARAGTAPWESALLIPSVAQSPAAAALQAMFTKSYELQAKLTAARQLYTDQYAPVKELVTSLDTLRKQTIPNAVQQILVELTQREGQFDTRIKSQSAELQAIPARTIEEMRLRRAVTVAEGLYTTLKTRYSEAQLAEASAIPDVTILDRAIAPLSPTSNRKPMLLLLGIAAGIGAGIGLALLLDRVDRRVQYPEQATNELGIPIAGAVPRLPRGGINQNSPEQVYQLVEAFRSLRMNVVSARDLPISLAVSSPSPSDGKSFISANLAMSFAEGGFKTLLVDADTRRGTLHDLFSLRRSPGLTDLLAGAADRASIIHPTSHSNLSLMPSGTRRRQSPEFLTSPMLKQLLDSLRTEYDVVICDTPPFAAGVDAYAIATAAERLVVVLRVGRTERRMAAAKMALLDRLPVEIVGAVLNSVQLNGEFQYYGYVRGYEARDEADEEATTALLRN
jgi:capsular exopolysaccharide synthesis family protein